MREKRFVAAVALLWGVLLAACAAPTSTATSTGAPIAAPTATKTAATPTKAPTATPTKMPMTKISIVASTFAANLNLAGPMLAKAEGYFKDESLDIDWVATGGGAKALAAVVGHSADLALIAGQDTVSAISQGQPAIAFAVVTTGKPYFMVIQKSVAAQRGITPQMSLAEKGRAVKGLTFGASSPGSGTDAMIRYFLLGVGLDPDRDVQITYVGSAAYVAAFDTGSIDVITTVVPEATLGQIRQGKGLMLVNFAAGDVPGIADTLEIVAAGHRDDAKARPQVYEAFTRGLWKAQKLTVQNPSKAKGDILKTEDFASIDPGLYEEYWNAFLPSLAKSPEITEKGFQATVEFRNKVEAGPPLVAKFSDFYEPRFVEAAKKQLGY